MEYDAGYSPSTQGAILLGSKWFSVLPEIDGVLGEAAWDTWNIGLAPNEAERFAKLAAG